MKYMWSKAFGNIGDSSVRFLLSDRRAARWQWFRDYRSNVRRRKRWAELKQRKEAP